MSKSITKRHKMEEAAIRLFATKGLARTVIKDIAREAGVTEGALYRHYPSKNDMAWTLFSREVEKFACALETVIFEPKKTLAEKLTCGIRFIYQYYQDDPIRFSFILLTQHGFPDERLLDEKHNPTDMVIRFIQAIIQESGHPAKDSIFTAGMIIGAVLQPIIMHRYGRLKQSPLEDVHRVIAACKHILEVA